MALRRMIHHLLAKTPGGPIKLPRRHVRAVPGTFAVQNDEGGEMVEWAIACRPKLAIADVPGPEAGHMLTGDPRAVTCEECARTAAYEELSRFVGGGRRGGKAVEPLPLPGSPSTAPITNVLAPDVPVPDAE